MHNRTFYWACEAEPHYREEPVTPERCTHVDNMLLHLENDGKSNDLLQFYHKIPATLERPSWAALGKSVFWTQYLFLVGVIAEDDKVSKPDFWYEKLPNTPVPVCYFKTCALYRAEQRQHEALQKRPAAPSST